MSRVHEAKLLDRAVQYMTMFLAGTLVFLLGVLLGTLGDDQPRQAPSAGNAPSADLPKAADFAPADLNTRRVRVIPLRPEDVPPSQ